MNDDARVPPHATRHTAVASYLAAAVALLFVMSAHLLPALIAGLLVYAVVDALAPWLERRWPGGWARQLVVGVLAVVVAGLLALLIFGAVAFFRAELGDPNTLFDRMMPTIDRARTQLPAWIVAYLPVSAEDFRYTATQLARTHAGQLQVAGKETAHVFGRILVGLALGALVALTHMREVASAGPLRRDLTARCARFAQAFHDIVFAQARISALNTLFTAIFLLIALPLAGVHLPLTKTLIAITFIVGLLPVVGNLVSNTLIVIVALSMSLWAALGALIFLILIHKLEYFLNAKIVGHRIHARAWEILLAMLVMEAAFGLPGVVAAPIYYAYLKSELTAARLI
ncbi:MAG: putative membrane protein [Rhodanobacteraceae bacterium]|nr:MAG: putative membrane protein [Rhodanobacteraceae bacterium]